MLLYTQCFTFTHFKYQTAHTHWCDECNALALCAQHFVGVGMYAFMHSFLLLHYEEALTVRALCSDGYLQLAAPHLAEGSTVLGTVNAT